MTEGGDPAIFLSIWAGMIGLFLGGYALGYWRGRASKD